MKTINKTLRHRIYRTALVIYNDQIEYGYNAGLCLAIHEANQRIGIIDSVPTPYSNMMAYPEIYKHKPGDLPWDGGYWFGTWDTGIRRRILNEAIELTKRRKNENH